ncbi:hypothetical protein Taro_016955 [Colocasia esculenta]|uniref:Cysteine-rich receptor-like protein kinase 25 n=1 Tax=Colocasia esculenta TaxID=4460 RepID=A0A843ULU5_COLES|nr:hypothetical protein [Colocasia esculenta]
MAQPLRPFSFPELAHLLLGLLVVVVATTARPLSQLCLDSGPDFPANGTYSSNVNRLISILTVNGPAAGYLNATVGDFPERVYGFILCRGDKTAADCRSCLATAAVEILQACPYKRTALVWYGNCMLKFSNLYFFSVSDSRWFGMRSQKFLTEDNGQFYTQLDALMKAVVRYAAYNASARMFGTGVANYSDPEEPIIYALGQCTRDQTPDACSACLTGINDDIQTRFRWRRGARILKSTCNFRYELSPFYDGPSMVWVPLPRNATWRVLQAPAAAPLPPPTAQPAAQGKRKKKNQTGTVLAIAIPVGAALMLATVLCICCSCHRQEKREKLNSQDITAIGSLLFSLSTLRTATCNFSQRNMLGQGGFGSVYKGLLPNGQQIAVKRLSAGSSQGLGELKNEVLLLAKLQHRNLVKLLGVCLEGDENAHAGSRFVLPTPGLCARATRDPPAQLLALRTHAELSVLRPAPSTPLPSPWGPTAPSRACHMPHPDLRGRTPPFPQRARALVLRHRALASRYHRRWQSVKHSTKPCKDDE